MSELTEEFLSYLDNLFDQDLDTKQRREKIFAILGRFENALRKNDQAISVFGENGYPEFSQGLPTNELQDVVTAEMLNSIVQMFIIPALEKNDINSEQYIRIHDNKNLRMFLK